MCIARVFSLLSLLSVLHIPAVLATELANEEDIVPSLPEIQLTIDPIPVMVDVANAPPLPLKILGSEIKPGEFRNLSWSPGQSFISIDTPVPVLVAHGSQRGPLVCLTAAIHGDELNGIEMIRRLMHQLNPERMSGSVIGIPIVNLDGFRRSSRYLSDRRDLNRHFPGNPKGSAADRMAYSLFTNVIRPHCQYLVDLHTGSLKRTNLPQIRGNLSNESVFQFSRHFGGITVLHGRGARGTLRRAAVDAGIPSMTLEAGGPNELEEVAVDGGVQAIETLLQNLGIQPTLRFWGSPQPVFYHSDWVRADQGGILMSRVGLGASVRKGEILGRVVDPVTNTGSNILAPFTGRVIGMAVNQVVQTGFAAYHLGVEKDAEEVKEEAKDQQEEVSATESAPGTVNVQPVVAVPVAPPVVRPPLSPEIAADSDSDECTAAC